MAMLFFPFFPVVLSEAKDLMAIANGVPVEMA
jgi:hypothetical protein